MLFTHELIVQTAYILSVSPVSVSRGRCHCQHVSPCSPHHPRLLLAPRGLSSIIGTLHTIIIILCNRIIMKTLVNSLEQRTSFKRMVINSSNILKHLYPAVSGVSCCSSAASLWKTSLQDLTHRENAAQLWKTFLSSLSKCLCWIKER